MEGRFLLLLSCAIGTAAAAGAQDLFGRLDRNGDGRLQRGELPPRRQADFGRLDRDGDGGISPEEFRLAAGPAR
jgi:Ca2+-binding EF-hand superfamily protein